MSTTATTRRALQRRYHLHPPGIIFIVLAVFVAVGAFNSQNNLLFWVFGVCIGVVLMSGLVSGPALMGVDLAREPVGTACAGEPFSLAYAVRGRSRLPLFALVIEELSPAKDALEQRPMCVIEHLSRGRSSRARATCTPIRRGEIELASVRVSTTFPFGLVKKSITFDLPERVVVYPARLEVKPELIRRSFMSGEQGTSLTRRIGTGEDFYGVREYTEGDPLRGIAWKASARTGSLVVTQRSSTAPVRLRITLDARSHDAPIETERAIALAAELYRAAQEAGLAAGFESASMRLPPRSSRGAIETVLRHLATYSADDAGAIDRRESQEAQLVVTASAERASASRTIDATDPSSYMAAGQRLPRALRAEREA